MYYCITINVLFVRYLIYPRDPCGRRNGQQPMPEMQKVLMDTIKEAKGNISKVSNFYRNYFIYNMKAENVE